MEQDICEYVLEHYRDKVEEALVETQRRNVEHGFVIIGNVGDRPQIQIQQGEAGSIDLPYIQADYDIGIVFHTHPTSRGGGVRVVESLRSPTDYGLFINYHVQPDNPPMEREDGFVRGDVNAAVTDESDDEMEFVLRGIQTADGLVGKTAEERRELALAMGGVVDGAYDNPAVPDWVEPPDAEGIVEGIREVAPGTVRSCDSFGNTFEV